MPQSKTHPIRQPKPTAEAIAALEAEIASLETALNGVETRINAFEHRLRVALQPQIAQLKELAALYKKLKRDKKEKRRAQKQRGKNYKEPTGLKKIPPINTSTVLRPADEEALKRLYKEAIVRVHPDKFIGDDAALSGRATAVTAQLNALYDAGDLEELSALHQHIISGNAMAHTPYQPQAIPDADAMMTYLRRKRDELAQTLQNLQTSELYTLLNEQPDPGRLIDSLRVQFEERIRVLTKRTRKA